MSGLALETRCNGLRDLLEQHAAVDEVLEATVVGRDRHVPPRHREKGLQRVLRTPRPEFAGADRRCVAVASKSGLEQFDGDPLGVLVNDGQGTERHPILQSGCRYRGSRSLYALQELLQQLQTRAGMILRDLISQPTLVGGNEA